VIFLGCFKTSLFQWNAWPWGWLRLSAQEKLSSKISNKIVKYNLPQNLTLEYYKIGSLVRVKMQKCTLDLGVCTLCLSIFVQTLKPGCHLHKYEFYFRWILTRSINCIHNGHSTVGGGGGGHLPIWFFLRLGGRGFEPCSCQFLLSSLESQIRVLWWKARRKFKKKMCACLIWRKNGGHVKRMELKLIQDLKCQPQVETWKVTWTSTKETAYVGQTKRWGHEPIFVCW
jgi:hypothetical protein